MVGSPRGPRESVPSWSFNPLVLTTISHFKKSLVFLLKNTQKRMSVEVNDFNGHLLSLARLKNLLDDVIIIRLTKVFMDTAFWLLTQNGREALG